MNLTGWKMPVLSSYLMEEGAVFSFIVQGFRLSTLFIGAVCNATTGSRSAGLVLLISLMLCFASLCFTEPKNVRRGEA